MDMTSGTKFGSSIPFDHFPETDIDSFMRIEEELRIKEFCIASSVNGIGISDLEGNITYVNGAFLDMWGGNNSSEVIGKSALEFAVDEAQACQIIKTVIEEGSWTGDITGKRKDGMPIDVHLSASLVYNNQGHSVALMCSFVNISEQKRVERELRVKESAIASSITGIGFGDLEGNITYVNDAAVRMYGAKNGSDLIGRPALSLAQSEDEALEIIRAVLENDSWSGEVTGKKKDGSPITVHLSAHVVRDKLGEPICTMDSFVDITERKRMEKDLRVKDSCIASAIMGIGIGDLEGNIIYVNDAAVNMWGASDPSEIIGRSSLEFAESKEEALHVIEALLESGSWTGEIKGRRKDGSPVFVLLSANLVYNEKGEPICTMDSFVDITERKQMEDELRIKDCAIASSVDGIAIGDLNGTITYVNRAFLDMWGGKHPDEVIGRSAVSFAKFNDQATEIINHLFKKGSWIGELTGKRKDESLLDLQLSASMVRNNNGDPICLLCSFRDITKAKQAEQALETAYADLEGRVQRRTKELVAANKKLRKEIEERKQAEKLLRRAEKSLLGKSQNLEETNTALTVLLKRREKDKEDIEEQMLSNIKNLVMPYLEKLSSTGLNQKQKDYLSILKRNLNDSVKPFIKTLNSAYLGLSPTQIQVADLVKEGKTTKEISELLNISDRGVEFHRNTIRNKLGLKNKKINLRSYLMQMQ